MGRSLVILAKESRGKIGMISNGIIIMFNKSKEMRWQ